MFKIFQITDTSGLHIGSGQILNGKVSIPVLNYLDKQFANVWGVFNENGFDLRFESGEIVFQAIDINNQYFNIRLYNGNVIGLARYQ
jgi:hypothetical protein